MKKQLPVVVMDRAIPFLADALAPYCEVRALAGGAISAADVRDADALVVRTRTQCGEALLKDSSVRLVLTATIGHDHIDRPWCEAHGIDDDYTEAVRQKYYRMRKAYAKNGMFLGKLRKNR